MLSRETQQALAGFWKKVSEREESFSCFGSVNLSKVDKKMNFQYWAFMLFYTEPNLIQSRACSTLKALTVQKRVSVIVTLSGQNTLSALIYPKLVVYPRGVCTHNEGSFGPPWGLQGAPQKMTPFIVVKL